MLAISQFITYNQVSMSIPNLFYKIKSKIAFDKITIIYLFIIVIVGISAFMLGRLSLYSTDGLNSPKMTLNSTNNLNLKEALSNSKIAPSEVYTQGEKRYLASKNGKMYYSLGCSGANRIKDENKVWFSTAIDAEKSGFSFATSCK
jgi:hypothetical protein